MPSGTFSCPVCGALCEAQIDVDQVKLPVDSLDEIKGIARETRIACPDHGPQRFQLAAGDHSIQGEKRMVIAFPQATRKHVRSLLTPTERAAFDAAYEGRRIPSRSEFEEWQRHAMTFKPEPPRTSP